MEITLTIPEELAVRLQPFEWDQYQYVEHLVRLAKAKAALKLKSA